LAAIRQLEDGYRLLEQFRQVNFARL